jgi:hypothetical protein
MKISIYYYDNKVRDDGTGEEYRTHRRDYNYKLFFKNEKEMDNFRDLGTHGS